MIHHSLRPEHIRTVRLHTGANCSSVGSAIDTLFWSATACGAVMAAVCSALAESASEDATCDPPSPPVTSDLSPEPTEEP
jgi:hypothetical protein